MYECITGAKQKHIGVALDHMDEASLRAGFASAVKARPRAALPCPAHRRAREGGGEGGQEPARSSLPGSNGTLARP